MQAILNRTRNRPEPLTDLICLYLRARLYEFEHKEREVECVAAAGGEGGMAVIHTRPYWTNAMSPCALSSCRT